MASAAPHPAATSVDEERAVIRALHIVLGKATPTADRNTPIAAAVPEKTNGATNDRSAETPNSTSITAIETDATALLLLAQCIP